MANRRSVSKSVGLLLLGGAAGSAANEHLTADELSVEDGANTGNIPATTDDATEQDYQARGLSKYGNVTIPANTEVSAGVATFNEGYCPYLMVQNNRDDTIDVTIGAEFLSKQGGFVVAGVKNSVTISAQDFHVAVFPPDDGDEAAATVDTIDLCRVELLD